jgi:diguanylate cyclase (GGDEF)-like protein
MTATQPNLLAEDVTQTTATSPTNGHRDPAPQAEPPLGEFLSAQCLASLSGLPGVVVYQRVVTPDEQIRYTYISEGARDLFGVSPEEILSDPEALFRRHSDEYKAKFRERLLAASKSLTTWDVEASIVTPDGRKKYTHAIARPERQPNGSVLWTGIILDETRTREAVVEGLSQGFLLYDADDRLILRNSHFLDLYPSLKDIAVPGARYEEVVRAEIATGANDPTQNTEPAAVLRMRMERHREARHIFEWQLEDSRWFLVDEYRTTDGGTVVLYTDITELKRREREIQFLADHDMLTGLHNRASFQRRAENAIVNAKKRGTTVAIMCLDLDNFKHVNDSLGHVAGDEFLKNVAKRLSACFREVDTVARFGGDEFGIVFANLNRPETATTLGSRLLEVISHPVDFNGQQIVSGVSIGIALSTSDGDTADRLIKNADLALYRAKTDGRGTFRFFEEEMDARAQARRALEIDLRQAVTRNQLELHYQPQIDILTNEIVGFESLVRWRHPKRGMIPPSDFIPLAEETGIIRSLGEWVLRRACTDARSWPDSIKVAVNVSPAQFRHQNITQLVSEVLQDTGLDPNRLELEITESILLRDTDENLSTLRDLKELGVRVSMDDFGTGYSSIGSLRSFPFDKIKIDRSFVNDLERSSDAIAIIHAVLGLGHSLGMATCAEGVETKEQLIFLRSEGCTEVQGYYYSKPKPVAEISDMLKTGYFKPAAVRAASAAAGVDVAPIQPAPPSTLPARVGTRLTD